MTTAADLDPTPGSRRRERWTAEQRGAAFRAYFSTGSRRKARKASGVPERTLSSWLTDDRYEQERLAVQEGLLRAVKQDAAVRGAELVEATKEAVLVCRKALRGDPDGRTASSLLSALCRARETEDRIARLDDGAATEIHGRQLSDEERVAFEAWYADRKARAGMTHEELDAEVTEAFLGAVKESMDRRDSRTMVGILRTIVAEGDLLSAWMRTDVVLARRLHGLVVTGLRHAEADAAEHVPQPPRHASAATTPWHGPEERS